MPYAYVVYDHVRAANVSTIRSWLTDHDVVLAGRYSEWAYYNSDHAFLAGKQAAEKVAELKRRDRSRATTVHSETSRVARAGVREEQTA
jgi:hypothetical protein